MTAITAKIIHTATIARAFAHHGWRVLTGRATVALLDPQGEARFTLNLKRNG